MCTPSKPIGPILVLLTAGHCERSAAIQTRLVVATAVLLLTLAASASAKYSGGTGEPNDPYQIATAADLIALGETPADYDKHFILTADIDLDPNLPGRKVFDRAVIAPDWEASFIGVFDGNHHTISRLTIRGDRFSSLFGHLGYGAEVKDIGLLDVNITASGSYAGGLVGSLYAAKVTHCYSTGLVCGWNAVGGLVGYSVHPPGNRGGGFAGYIAESYSTATVIGHTYVGGLVGQSSEIWFELSGNPIVKCYSKGSVYGDSTVGGLVGSNDGGVTNSYSIGAVSGTRSVGGLVGDNYGSVNQCYSTGAVTGEIEAGGLVGGGVGEVTVCFWDTQTSGQTVSTGGTGKTTAEMQTARTFLDAGWDFVGETTNGTADIWKIVEGQTYPLLSWQKYSGGAGEPNDPYQIATAGDLIALGETPEDYDKHFILTGDIDLDPNVPGGKVFDKAVIAWDTDPVKVGFQGTPFTGVLDGNNHTISHLTITGVGYIGLFGCIESGAVVRDLGVVDVNIIGSGKCVAGLVGFNEGNVTNCYSTGTVSGIEDVGGLVGRDYHHGSVIQCYSTSSVSGDGNVGGLVGFNGGALTYCYSAGSVMGGGSVGGLVGMNWGGLVNTSFSSASVCGNTHVGGLIGENSGEVTNCYSTSKVSGDGAVGGLVGLNCLSPFRIRVGIPGLVAQCYSTGAVSGTGNVGGLVGENKYDSTPWGPAGEGIVSDSFWDTQTSGTFDGVGDTDPDPNGVVGKTTAEMQNIQTYQHAGWDLVGEIGNGTSEIWRMPEEGGYPMLATFSGYTPPELQGMGTLENPYLISDALELGAMVHYSPYAHYRLATPIDLSGIHWNTSVISQFEGTFDGGGHAIKNLHIQGCTGYLGLFGQLGSSAKVSNLVLEAVDVDGTRSYAGALAGSNGGNITASYSTGSVIGYYGVGGLVGRNGGEVANCYSTSTVVGDSFVGGLVGLSWGNITTGYSSGSVNGTVSVGGLVGDNQNGSVTSSFWDTQTSGQTMSDGGTGKTTAEMQMATTFLDAGWDFVGETANGTENIWWINEGKDYPRLWWEGAPQ